VKNVCRLKPEALLHVSERLMINKPILKTTRNVLEYSSTLPYIKTELLLDYVEKINPGKLKSQDYSRTSYSLLLHEIGP
jgi:hypothetical protein